MKGRPWLTPEYILRTVLGITDMCATRLSPIPKWGFLTGPLSCALLSLSVPTPGFRRFLMVLPILGVACFGLAYNDAMKELDQEAVATKELPAGKTMLRDGSIVRRS